MEPHDYYEREARRERYEDALQLRARFEPIVIREAEPASPANGKPSDAADAEKTRSA